MDNLFTNYLKVGLLLLVTVLTGCNSHSTLPSATLHPSNTNNINAYKYLIGSGDVLNIFVAVFKRSNKSKRETMLFA